MLCKAIAEKCQSPREARKDLTNETVLKSLFPSRYLALLEAFNRKLLPRNRPAKKELYKGDQI